MVFSYTFCLRLSVFQYVLLVGFVALIFGERRRRRFLYVIMRRFGRMLVVGGLFLIHLAPYVRFVKLFGYVNSRGRTAVGAFRIESHVMAVLWWGILNKACI